MTPFFGSTKSLLSPHLSTQKITVGEWSSRKGSEEMHGERGRDVAGREWIVSLALKA